jgi:hypothetical protein
MNPFRVFEFFLNDRVERELVRQGNNNLVRISDELWVFGEVIANGVLFEILYARSLGKPVHFHNIATRSLEIYPIPVETLRFEHELYKGGWDRDGLIDLVSGANVEAPHPNRLFDPDIPFGNENAPIVRIERRA